MVEKKLLKLTSVERKTPGSTSKPSQTMWKEGKGFSHLGLCCVRISTAAVKMKSALPGEIRGVCPRRSSSIEEQSLPTPQWILAAPTATGQAPGSSTSTLQMLPIFDIYNSKWYFLNSLWAAWSVFWTDDKSHFFELHLCLLSYNSRLLLPWQCRFFMQNVTVCNFQGIWHFWGFIFSFYLP